MAGDKIECRHRPATLCTKVAGCASDGAVIGGDPISLLLLLLRSGLNSSSNKGTPTTRVQPLANSRPAGYGQADQLSGGWPGPERRAVALVHSDREGLWVRPCSRLALLQCRARRASELVRKFASGAGGRKIRYSSLSRCCRWPRWSGQRL